MAVAGSASRLVGLSAVVHAPGLDFWACNDLLGFGQVLPVQRHSIKHAIEVVFQRQHVVNVVKAQRVQGNSGRFAHQRSQLAVLRIGPPGAILQQITSQLE